MTTQEIIEQTEKLSFDEQKNLASYFVLRFMNPDNQNLMHLFHYRNDFENLRTDNKKNNFSEKNKFRRFDKFKGKVKMSDDFNEPLEEFNNYMY